MKKLAVVSDLQCGSIFGMLPPDFLTSEGIPKLQNVGQRYLWECWIDFADRLKEFSPDAIVVNGDLIDGTQHAQKGTEFSLPLLFDQTESAERCLSVLKKRCPDMKWYFVQGTEYHVGKAAQHEEQIAKSMGGERYASIGSGIYVREVLWLDVEGVIIECSHHISVTQGFYRLTALDRRCSGAPWQRRITRKVFLRLTSSSAPTFITSKPPSTLLSKDW